MNTIFKHILIYFLLFILSPFSLFSQVAASAELDSTNMLIGDQMSLHLMVNHPAGTTVLSPEMKVLEESKIEVLNVTGWDTLQKGVEYVLKKDILFTAWDSGYVFIPKIPVPYESGGQTGIATTSEIPLMVGVPQIDTTLAPIKDIIREPQTIEDFIPVIAAVLGLILAGLLFWYFYNRKDKIEAKPKPEIILPPHELALNKLTNLKKEKLWQKGEVKAYQSQLTYIVREYLENRFEVPALENTTDEILRSLKSMELSEDWEDKLREMLQMADLVKFAKAKPGAEFHDRMMTNSEEFVYATKPQRIVGEEEEVLDSETEEGNKKVIYQFNLPDNDLGDSMEFATFWQKFFAFLIDISLNILVSASLTFLTGYLIGTIGLLTATLINVFVPIIFMWFYFAWPEHHKKATLGKLMMKIEVVDTDGNQISLGIASLRLLGKFVSVSLLMLGYVPVFFSEEKQALHDVMASTIIVKKNPTLPESENIESLDNTSEDKVSDTSEVSDT